MVYFSFMKQTAVKTENKTSKSLIESMFEVGAHYGYSRRRRHPSFKPLIFGAKNTVDIIDLEQTNTFLNKTLEFIKQLGREEKKILFIGTKPEAKKAIEEIAVSLDLPHVSNRWIGGTITNLAEIKKRIARLEELSDKKEKGELDVYTKKEKLVLDDEIRRLSNNFSGIVTMTSIPDAVFVVDPKHEKTAIREARQKEIPIIALAGSDCNIDEVDYFIPANDSSRGSIEFFIGQISKAYKDGKDKAQESKEKGKEDDQDKARDN